jgi:hypothetical protein
MSKYTRTAILDFSDLPTEKQEELKRSNELSDLHSDNYVIDPCDKNEYLPLGMFMRMEKSKLWDGYYSQTVWSAYFIKLSPCRTMATVGYRHW